MPKKKKSAAQVDRDKLMQLKQGGAESTVLDCHLQYKKAAQLHDSFIAPMSQRSRVFPSFLPTQASGRWSMVGLYRANFPAPIQDVVIPDPGTYWLKFDLDAIEAKLVAAMSNDEEDLTAFRLGQDIHTITSCRTYGMPLPPLLTKACHKAPECEEWRQAWSPPWEGGDDLRRRLNKVLRYGLFYGPDETAILNAKGVEELGIGRAELLDAARRYLNSKPVLKEWKVKTWDRVLYNREARTFLGRRRRLFVTKKDLELWVRSGRRRPPECAREGLNHEVQGAVADIMNLILINILNRWSCITLAQHLHDGLVLAVPKPVTVWPTIREEVECAWQVTPQHSIVSTAEFLRVNADGSKEELRP